MDKQSNKQIDYKVISNCFQGSNGTSYTYQISLNKSTEHTQRLWQGIERGLTLYEKWETTNNPIKKWFIGKVLGFKKY